MRSKSLQPKLGADDESLLELQSLISAFNHLPGREEAAPEKRAERLRDKEIHKRRLAALCARSPEVAEFIGQSVAKINGVAGDANSLDSLHELIKAQAYRLAYWRVAADDINYRGSSMSMISPGCGRKIKQSFSRRMSLSCS